MSSVLSASSLLANTCWSHIHLIYVYAHLLIGSTSSHKLRLRDCILMLIMDLLMMLVQYRVTWQWYHIGWTWQSDEKLEGGEVQERRDENFFSFMFCSGHLHSCTSHWENCTYYSTRSHIEVTEIKTEIYVYMMSALVRISFNTMNLIWMRKERKNEKICFILYAVSDLPLLCLSSSRQVENDRWWWWREKENRTQGQCMHVQKTT